MIYSHNSENEIDIYRFILENTNECIFIFDITNRMVRYISPSVKDITGFSRDEIFSLEGVHVHTPEFIEKIHQIIQVAMEEMKSNNFSEVNAGCQVIELFTKNNGFRPFEVSFKVLKNEARNSIELLAVVRNQIKAGNLDDLLISKGSNATKIDDDNKTRIYCFGKFRVLPSKSNLPLKWRTKKAEELFAFFVNSHENDLSKWTICDAVFPDCSFDKMDVYLHTTIYKMKKALSDAGVKFKLNCKNGFYRMSLEEAYIDTDIINNMLDRNFEVKEKIVDNYIQLANIYSNTYLEGNDYTWAIPIRENYTKKAIQIGKFLLNYFTKRNEYDTLERIINKMLENFPFSEFAHESLLKLYFIQNDRIAFFKHYKYMRNLYKKSIWNHSTELIKYMINEMHKKDQGSNMK